jgi:hypothetical protein
MAKSKCHCETCEELYQLRATSHRYAIALRQLTEFAKAVNWDARDNWIGDPEHSAQELASRAIQRINDLPDREK